VRVLLDEQLPRQLAQGLLGHEVRTVQQNLVRSSLRVIVLVAPSNALEDLLPLVPSVLRSIPDTRPGQVQRVDG
jgi:hypothetical protein